MSHEAPNNAKNGWTQGLGPFSGTAELMARFSARFLQSKAENEDDVEVTTASDTEETAAEPVVASEKKPAALAQDTPEAPSQIAEASQTADDVMELLAREKAEEEAAATPGAKEAVPTRSARSLPYPDVKPDEARIAMSACLLGHKVRYNEGHCMARSIVDSFGQVFKFVPVCPEVDIGLGTPRPTLRLVLNGKGSNAKLSKDMTDVEDLAEQVELWCPEKGEDYTERMYSYTKAKVLDLKGFGIDGFILKRDSPSCGLDRVKLYESKKELARGMKAYQGLFARTLVKEWPELPVTEEGRLTDEDTRNNFIQQVLCHQKWRELDGSFKSVLAFHTNHKYNLLAQSPAVLKELGVLLSKGPKFFASNNVKDLYYTKFFGAMKVMVGRGRHTNVLLHLTGYIKKSIDPELYSELQGSVQDYHDGLVPLVVPLKLLQVCSKTATASKDKEFLATASAYAQGAPRSLKAHTSISTRTSSKVPAITEKLAAEDRD